MGSDERMKEVNGVCFKNGDWKSIVCITLFYVRIFCSFANDLIRDTDHALNIPCVYFLINWHFYIYTLKWRPELLEMYLDL